MLAVGGALLAGVEPVEPAGGLEAAAGLEEAVDELGADVEL